MKCKKCGEIKLSNEFPSTKLDESCDHPSLHCLRCVTSHWEQTKQCSQCSIPVAHTSLNLRKCFQTLELLFPMILPDKPGADDSLLATSGKITVMRLNGEAAEVDYNPQFTIRKMKKLIFDFFKVPPDKQRLVHNANELKDLQDNAEATLGFYNVTPGATVHLMVLLYAVPASLKKVVFDLYWGYPPTGPDFLDASALVFSEKSYLEVIDFCHRNNLHNAIDHSGDLLDDEKELGHHIINVDLQRVPVNVSSIFFTLSAWTVPTISHFKTPCLKFYEASNPDRMLCEDKTQKAGHRQAVVMCSLSRRGGQWFVDGNGALSDGNAENYDPLISTIEGLILKMGQ